MREVKFRAWDKEAKKFWWWQDLKTKIANFFELEFLDVQQFTGLLDKNGKEIYEGDIVDEFLSDAEDKNYLYHGIVEYLGCSFVLKIKDKSFIELKNTGHNLEIIGNIYENPELLTN